MFKLFLKKILWSTVSWRGDVVPFRWKLSQKLCK